jgi:hypothetical protein
MSISAFMPVFTAERYLMPEYHKWVMAEVLVERVKKSEVKSPLPE